MQKTRFPKTVEFLRNSMQRKEGYDLGLAQELTQLVNELGKVEADNSNLQAENEALSAALQVVEEVFNCSNEPVAPQYPNEFYIYGNDAMYRTPNDDEIQEIIDELYEVELKDGQFIQDSSGDTTVIKLRDAGIERIIVAQGYASSIVYDEDEDAGCGDPECECSSVRGIGIYL